MVKCTNKIIDKGMIETHTGHVKLIIEQLGELMYDMG